MTLKLPKPPDDQGHPTQNTFDPYPNDSLLRRHGYKIHSRPKKGPVKWIRNGVVENQRDVLKRLSTVGHVP